MVSFVSRKPDLLRRRSSGDGKVDSLGRSNQKQLTASEFSAWPASCFSARQRPDLPMETPHGGPVVPLREGTVANKERPS